MAYPSNYYTKAQEIIDNRRFDNSVTIEKRTRELRREIPEIGDIDRKLSGTIDVLAKIILSRNSDAREKIERLKNENLALQDRMRTLLKSNGYPEDYLDPIFTCKKCCDTGIGEHGRCSCYNDVLKMIASRELSKSLPMGLTCFESFDLSLYSDQPKAELKNKSPRDIMKQNYDFCVSYAEDFLVPGESIFMTGGTGLGKTHLSLSVAKKVIEKNYSVVYGSVPDLLRRIENAHFNKTEDDAEVMNTLKECDLLLLDDLGAEFESQFYVSCLYELINTRLNYGRPTIVNTNLTGTELKKRYADRIVSRLYSMKTLVFSGDDIRMKLKTRR